MKRKTFIYTDESNDEFSGIKRNTITIDSNYKYIHSNVFWRICEVLVYRFLLVPFAAIYTKIKFHHKYVNKHAIKNFHRNDYFIYSNHTMLAGDAFIPSLISLPRKSFTIVHPDNVSVKLTRPFIVMCGALPTPSSIGASKNFLSAIEYRAKTHPIIIFPEAHIWPYYTGIRPFDNVSFKYPVKLDKPIFILTNTFHKRKFSRTPRVITFIDGPFYPNKNLSPKEQVKELRDITYSTMCKRALNSNYSAHTFQKKEMPYD